MVTVSDTILAGVLNDLAGPGWSVCDDFLCGSAWRDLAEEGRKLYGAGRFRAAGVGQGQAGTLAPGIRSDSILWLEPDRLTTTQQACLDRFDELRLAVNRELYLGLQGFECHLAIYPPGSFYRKHLDQFRGVDARQLTVVFYLNDGWTEDNGGQLRIYLDEEGGYQDIQPQGGRLVTFLSARFYHEVLPARRERMSLTGWFKRSS
ncbi:2OG-Fe(II) oxygenase [Methylococcus sp. EFPC2]|uniref:2OG-Fe(II) oxygenase n=1 Tax=Methylococcus sp. EFPC2 TaxID=2812648 RepID=UPI00196797BE|nr:2OG-Fe(II) oxygenase [Methylococcus sp. EFPC2]QSA98311.1 2OG-Fe(II) oxygenase [Methylococcus sp. EFPC2]